MPTITNQPAPMSNMELIINAKVKQVLGDQSVQLIMLSTKLEEAQREIMALREKLEKYEPLKKENGEGDDMNLPGDKKTTPSLRKN